MSKITRISALEAKKRLDNEGYVFLDVRSEAEYEAGHPVGAHNVPIQHAGPGGMQPNPDFLRVVQAHYSKATKIILGCRSGVRSLRAAELMYAMGYSNLLEMRSGYEGVRDSFGELTEPGWVAAGLPTETTTVGGSYAELKQKKGR